MLKGDIEYKTHIENINSETCFGIMTYRNGEPAFFEAVNRHGLAVHFRRWNGNVQFLAYSRDTNTTRETKEKIVRLVETAGQQIPEPFRPIFQLG